MGKNYPNHPWISSWGQTYLPTSRTSRLLEAWRINKQTVINHRHLACGWNTCWRGPIGRPLADPIHLAPHSYLYRAAAPLLLLLCSSMISFALLISIACAVSLLYIVLAFLRKWINEIEMEKKKGQWSLPCKRVSHHSCIVSGTWGLRLHTFQSLSGLTVLLFRIWFYD